MKNNNTNLVLLLDDDKNFLESCKRVFRKTNFTLIAVSTAEEAISLLETQTFHTIISDLKMPAIGGIEFLKNTYHTQPDAKRILVTGEPTLASLTLGVNMCKLHSYFTKPFSASALIKQLEEQ